MDTGHKLTDDRLKQLEKRLLEEYTNAAEDIQKKIDEYTAPIKKKDAVWQKWVENGNNRKDEIDEWRRLVNKGERTEKEFFEWCKANSVRTEDQYIKWKQSQIAMGERWESMKDSIAEDMLHTNAVAQQIINQEMPTVFGLNANYALYQVEHDALIDTSLTLYNREAVDRILRKDPDLLLPPGKRVSKAIAQGKAKRWERQKVQSVMIQQILQGESIPKMAKRLAETVCDSDYKAAVRNARTMATNAQNAGRYDAYERLQNKGVDITLEWAATLDNRTRHEHRLMHGQRRDVGEPFEVDGVKIMYPAQTGSFMGVSTVPQDLIWNCRCTILAYVKGFEHDTIKHSEKMGDLSFEEWLDAKEEPQDILSQKEKGEAIRGSYIAEYKRG